MHECLLCKRDMKTSNDTFGNGCIKNIYSFLEMSMPKSIFSSTLYNLAHYSVKFGVMKEYNIDIQFKMNNSFEVIE